MIIQEIANEASTNVPLARKRRVHTLNEVADILEVSRQTIYNLYNRKELRISKILGKSVVYDEDLEDYIAVSKQGAR